ncbi:sperm-associated antigen 7-like [Argiope bruennichi]|uniref:sperm-associated antigen 7-like n=1 Tax=Argiope bruennichi TaxID=94029 RepID=UPI002494D2E8|nr:sperm-associated antigen 7-like [Argiope bruennichi]
MSDLLGSILSSMEKPPSGNSERNKLLQKQKKILEKQQAAQRAKLTSFREKIEKTINDFIQDPLKQNYKFSPTDKVYRNIIHDVADIAGLCTYAFGEDEVDRYVMVFKKEYAPSEEELKAYRNGEEWDPIKAKEAALQREKHKLEEVEERNKRDFEVEPACNYASKYEKLLGRDAGIAAAKIATPNKQFGFVPSEQKKDQRSIEQTLDDIQAKKKLKKAHDAVQSVSETSS